MKQSTVIEPSASADLSRKEWRDLIWPKNRTENQRKAYDPRLIREFGCPAGLLLSQLVFWSEKGWDPEGWIYKTALEIKAEVGLTERQTAYARDSLVDEGTLKADLRPRRDTNGRVMHPSRVYHYLVDLEALAATQHETTAARGRVIPSLPPPSPPPPELSPGEVTEMLSAIFDRHTDAGRKALAHLGSGEPRLEKIAEALCVQFQKPQGWADRYLVRLPEALEELRLETVGVAS